MDQVRQGKAVCQAMQRGLSVSSVRGHHHHYGQLLASKALVTAWDMGAGDRRESEE